MTAIYQPGVVSPAERLFLLSDAARCAVFSVHGASTNVHRVGPVAVEQADGVFAARSLQEPSDRGIGYVQFGRANFRRALPEFACRLGRMVEESCATHAALRKARGKHIGAHSSVGKADIERYLCEVRAACRRSP